MTAPSLPGLFLMMIAEIEADLAVVVQGMRESQIWSVHGWQ
jgi:hypothetical protein